MRTTLLIATCVLLPFAAAADPVTDALDAAQTAYGAGRLSDTAAQLIAATRGVQALQAERLQAMLPEPSDGWTRSFGDTGGGGMAMMGVTGTMVEGQYTHSDGRYFTISMTADSPMVAGMAGMLGSPQMMAMMGNVVQVGSLPMLDQGESLSALVANRVLLQAQGAAVDAMLPMLATMDMDRLGRFDE